MRHLAPHVVLGDPDRHAEALGVHLEPGHGRVHYVVAKAAQRLARVRGGVRTGDAATIRIEYLADQRIDKPVFGLAIETLEGVYVWASNTRDADYVPDHIEGSGSIEFRIPRLMLLPGTFDISASIVDYSTIHVYDFHRHCYRFDVDHGTPRESGGVVSLGGSWGNLTKGQTNGHSNDQSDEYSNDTTGSSS